jgi:hypothetical protein
MKTVISLTNFLYIIFFSQLAIGQTCLFEDDYATDEGWTQVGTLVSVEDGAVQFKDGAPGEQQRRVHKNIETNLDEVECWELKCEFTPEELGTYLGEAFVSHYIAALTAGSQEPLYDCPDVPCTGYPTGTQDGIIIIASASNPPTGETFISLRVKDGATLTASGNIVFETLNTTYFIKLKRSSATLLELAVYSDELYSEHLPGSPIEMEISETVDDLTVLQHGNSAGGNIERELTGSVDNTCLSVCSKSSIDELTSTVKLSVYPNPAFGNVNIESSEHISSITLVSLSGAILQDWDFNDNKKLRSISTVSISTGIYFLRIQTGEAIETRKIIVR